MFFTKDKFVVLFIVLLFLIPSCGEDKKSVPEKQVTTEKVLYKAKYDDLKIRETPGLKGIVNGNLLRGEIIEYLNEKSEFTSKITLEGEEFNEHWIKVKLTNGNSGWVYRGAVEKIITDKKTMQEISPEQEELNDDLLRAAHRGRLRRVKRLVKKGANIKDARNESGWNALHYACAIHDNPDMPLVKYILTNGVDINLADVEGNTPLHIAYKCSFESRLTRYLIENGANTNATNNEGIIPSKIARYNAHIKN